MIRTISTLLCGALLLTGCSGTRNNFECDATTSDTCMTMEQANEKAKREEEKNKVKRTADALPLPVELYHLGDPGSAKNISAQAISAEPGKSIGQNNNPEVEPPRMRLNGHNDVSVMTTPPLAPVLPRPVRRGEQTVQIWIAPYIDSNDVWHQPGTVIFVLEPTQWAPL